MKKLEMIAKKEKERNMIIENIEEIKKMYEIELLTIGEISKKFNVKYYNLKPIMENYNIRIRTHKENQTIMMNRPDVKKHISNGSKNSQQKRKETNLKKYGSEVPACGINWKDDYEKKHGVRHPNQREEAKENMRGDNNPAKRAESKQKIKEERWDKKTQEELDLIWNKTKETWKNNMGVDNPLKSKENVEKIKKTNIIRRGVEWVSNDPKVKEKIIQSNFLRMKNLVEEKLKVLDLELVNEFTNVTSIIKIKCKKCNNIFETVLDYVFHEYGKCPTCYPRCVSNVEREIRDYIQEILIDEEIIFNDRKILNGKEIDILIPSKKIGIELDGLYYHCEIHGITEKYHLDKTELGLKKDLQIIHIFEDEWYFKKDIVKHRLKRILNIDNSPKIYARKCIIKEINTKEKNDFLEKYHIQGKDISLVRLGAFYNDKLVALMTFSHGNISKGSKSIEGVWELNRFCSDYNYSVIGIGSKLLEYFKRNFNWFEIFSYCDRRWSVGNAYYKLGFTLNKITEPNYWYVNNITRIHRFNLRKKENEPKEITEVELRKNEGYSRIWDCGNLKFILKNDKFVSES